MATRVGISYIDVTSGTGTSTTVAVTVPTLALPGDILVAQVSQTAENVASTAMTWPGTWTVLQSVHGVSGAANGGMEVAWHLMASGDSSFNVTTSAVTGGMTNFVCTAYRGVHPVTPLVSTSMSAFTATSSSPVTSGSATSSVPGVWRVETFISINTGGRDWSSYSPADTERADAGQDPSSGTYRCQSALADSNGTVDASAGVTITATPAGGATNIGRMAFIGLLTPDSRGGQFGVNYQAINRAYTY